MVEAVDVLRANAVRELKAALDLERLRLDPLSVLPIAAVGGDFAEIDLGVKVRGKRIAMVASVSVENIHAVDLVEIVLLCVGNKHAGHARVKSGTEQRG